MGAGLACMSSQALATSYSFQPSSVDLGDLDHHYAYTWGISNTQLRNELLNDYVITSATLTIYNIWDWRVETDKLFINLLDDTKSGVRTIADNTNDNVISDLFATPNINYFSARTQVTTWSDPIGGQNTGFDFQYQFTAAAIGVMTQYITNTTMNYRTMFGLGFDPDCHYFNDGVKLKIITAYCPPPPPSVPDTGSTAAMLVPAVLLAAYLRRRRLGAA